MKKRFQQGLSGPDGGLNRQFLPNLKVPRSNLYQPARIQVNSGEFK